jgi:NAD(P)-dependent dehydrogenase (short-subunit alcohol dehydrogenase family)
VVGHFVLTQILLPKLEATAGKFGSARIVVTSSLHMGCQELELDLTMSPHRFKSSIVLDSCWRYARSKLGNILFTRELARRLEKKGALNVYANVFFPGNIPTDAMDTWRDLFGAMLAML